MFDFKMKYCGDDVMSEHLHKADSLLTLHGVYGLFHGCIATPGIVMPSEYFPMIQGKDREFETLDQAREFMGQLMGLWNLIAHWVPETEVCIMPNVKYSDTIAGLETRAANDTFFMVCFVRGLKLGRSDKSDLSDDVVDSLESLLEIQELLEQYSDVSEMDGANEQVNIQKAFKLIADLEKTIGDHVARINIGLKPARMQKAQDMRPHHDYNNTIRRDERKIGRNEPCPCGSGKKYKKCCGLVH
jgi:yecA family protein